jgi:hypothetical protein
MNQAFLKLRLTVASAVLFACFALPNSGCGVYSMTGASIPPDAKTVSVAFFPNKAQLVVATLSPLFTEALQDEFINQTNLELVERNGDLAMEGEIVEYRVSPVAIQGDQTAALNRLTIAVNVRFTNRYEPDKDFEQKFSQFIEYDASSDLAAIQEDLIETITGFLANDIFNKAVINW